MSKKILIDSDVLTQALEALGVGLIMSEPHSKEDTFSTSIFSDSIEKISTAIKEAEEKRFSILEWHPISEKPKEGGVVVRMDDGSYALDYAIHWGSYTWQFQNNPIKHVKKWAYPPESED